MKFHHLTEDQRSQIYALKSNGFTQKAIAEFFSVHPSTISRELRRNRGQRGYRPKQAQRLSEDRRSKASQRPKKMLPAIVTEIEEMLRKGLVA